MKYMFLSFSKKEKVVFVRSRGTYKFLCPFNMSAHMKVYWFDEWNKTKPSLYHTTKLINLWCPNYFFNLFDTTKGTVQCQSLGPDSVAKVEI